MGTVVVVISGGLITCIGAWLVGFAVYVIHLIRKFNKASRLADAAIGLGQRFLDAGRYDDVDVAVAEAKYHITVMKAVNEDTNKAWNPAQWFKRWGVDYDKEVSQ